MLSNQTLLNNLFFALSHELRRDIIGRLLRLGEVRVTGLAQKYRVSLNTVSKHLRCLEKAGLIQRFVRGREHIINLRPEQMKKAWQFLEYYRKFWESTLDNLDELLTNKE